MINRKSTEFHFFVVEGGWGGKTGTVEGNMCALLV